MVEQSECGKLNSSLMTTNRVVEEISISSFRIEKLTSSINVDWQHPLLEIFRPQGLPQSAKPSKLYLVPSRFDDEFDPDFAPEPTSARDLPELQGWTERFAHSIVEIAALSGALFILFAQEVLETTVFIFAILGTAAAVGGIFGGLLGPKVSEKIGRGRSLALALFTMPLMALLIGFSSLWYLVWIFVAIETFTAVLWNVVTVSLRQSLIPSHLLGRVNSVYRFFAWGTIPIGTLLGGALVSALQSGLGREMAFRSVYFTGAALGFLLFVYAIRVLTEEKIEEARVSASGS